MALASLYLAARSCCLPVRGFTGNDHRQRRQSACVANGPGLFVPRSTVMQSGCLPARGSVSTTGNDHRQGPAERVKPHPLIIRAVNPVEHRHIAEPSARHGALSLSELEHTGQIKFATNSLENSGPHRGALEAAQNERSGVRSVRTSHRKLCFCPSVSSVALA